MRFVWGGRIEAALFWLAGGGRRRARKPRRPRQPPPPPTTPRRSFACKCVHLDSTRTATLSSALRASLALISHTPRALPHARRTTSNDQTQKSPLSFALFAPNASAPPARGPGRRAPGARGGPAFCGLGPASRARAALPGVPGARKPGGRRGRKDSALPLKTSFPAAPARPPPSRDVEVLLRRPSLTRTLPENARPILSTTNAPKKNSRPPLPPSTPTTAAAAPRSSSRAPRRTATATATTTPAPPPPLRPTPPPPAPSRTPSRAPSSSRPASRRRSRASP